MRLMFEVHLSSVKQPMNLKARMQNSFCLQLSQAVSINLTPCGPPRKVCMPKHGNVWPINSSGTSGNVLFLVIPVAQ